MRAKPGLEPDAMGLVAGGWKHTRSFAQDGGAEDDDGKTLLDMVLSFEKTFESADPEEATLDAKQCGVTSEFCPNFSWDDQRERSEDDELSRCSELRALGGRHRRVELLEYAFQVLGESSGDIEP